MMTPPPRSLRPSLSHHIPPGVPYPPSLAYVQPNVAQLKRELGPAPTEPTAGLTLLRSTNKSGFRYVNRMPNRNGYCVRLARDGRGYYLGKFATPEEGASHVARWLECRAEVHGHSRPRPMTAIEAIDAAAGVGLVLVRANNDSGFRHVVYDDRINKYQARPSLNGRPRSVGFFDTAEEAALRVAQTPGHYAVAAVATVKIPSTRGGVYMQ